MNEERPTLIYDAECRLCVSSKDWIEQWNTKQRIRFLPFQSDEAKRLLPELRSMDEMRLVCPKEGVTSSGVDAFYGMLPYLQMGWVIAVFFRLPGVYRLVVFLYGIIARHRYRWFGAVPKE
jgi:predicted DCC family thiol-disulfide oxidoreductase YuxK